MIHGILVLNKPAGITSNLALQKVKRLLGAKKAGHTGSLDPIATGMLPICFGEATKFSQYLLDADKSYQAKALLGIKTNTADALGEIIARCDHFNITKDQLLDTLQNFKGNIQQIPSMFSALKHQGRPLYALARKGIEIERKARDILISKLELLDFDGKQFSIDISCSKGTYIRNLVEDIGEKLKTYAHLIALHRTSVADFVADDMITLDALEQMSIDERLKRLLPIERILHHFPNLVLSDEEVIALQHGKPLHFADISVEEGLVCLQNKQLGFIGLGEWTSASILKAKRLVAF